MTIRLVFITRVKKFDPINDHMIDVNKDLTNTISKPDEKNPRPREKSQNKNEHINTQNHHQEQAVNIVSVLRWKLEIHKVF